MEDWEGGLLFEGRIALGLCSEYLMQVYHQRAGLKPLRVWLLPRPTGTLRKSSSEALLVVVEVMVVVGGGGNKNTHGKKKDLINKSIIVLFENLAECFLFAVFLTFLTFSSHA